MSVSLLPTGLIDNLKILPNNIAVAGLLRHAERQPFLPGDFGNEVTLTEKGIVSCQSLANKLNTQLIQLYTSPVKRCLQTAELLSSTAKFSCFKTSNLLGDPGIFIIDRHQAHDYCTQHDPVTMVRHLLSQQRNPAGFCYSTEASVFELIQYLLNAATEPGLTLFITHDSILSVVLGIIFEQIELDELWPDYLECLFLWRQQNFIHLIYRGQYKQLLWIN